MELRDLFEGLTDPETGEEVFSVFDGDAIFPATSGPRTS